MKKAILALALVLALVTVADAETSFNTASVTNASQTIAFTTPRSGVVICNDSASAAVFYFRLFNENDTPAAATNAYSPVAVGACIAFSKAPSQSAHFKAISLYSASTATANIYSE
jgi:hypothetical protein